MSLAFLGLTVLCSLLWAGFDFFRKDLVAKVPPLELLWWLVAIQIPLFGALLFIYAPDSQVDWAGYWLPAVILLVTNFFSNIWFLQALKLAPISQTIPMLSLTPLFATLVSYIQLGETLLPLQIFGVFLTVAGIFWLNGVPLLQSLRSGKFREERHLFLGIFLMTLVALFWSVTPVLDKVSLKFSGIYMHILIQIAALWLMLTAYLMVRGINFLKFTSIMKSKAYWGSFFTLSFALFIQISIISHVTIGIFESVKRAVGVFSALILGAIFFKESVNRNKALACLVIVVGVFLLFSNRL